MSKVSLTQSRRTYKNFRAAMELPDPMVKYEDWVEVHNPARDLVGADRLELRKAWQSTEMRLLFNDGNRILCMDSLGGFITVEDYLLRRLAAIRRLWREATG